MIEKIIKLLKTKLVIAIIIFLSLGFIFNLFTNVSQQGELKQRLEISQENKLRIDKLEMQVKTLQEKAGINTAIVENQNK